MTIVPYQPRVFESRAEAKGVLRGIMARMAEDTEASLLFWYMNRGRWLVIGNTPPGARGRSENIPTGFLQAPLKDAFLNAYSPNERENVFAVGYNASGGFLFLEKDD